MGNSSRETVKIFDQEYTIAGNSSGEQIVLVANYVDTLMHELAAALPSLPKSSLAVLTAVNVANDYFDEKERSSGLESVISDLKKDANQYIQMWEDAKKSFKQYKEDSQNSIEQLQELQRIYNTKNVELNRANEALETMKARYEADRNELLRMKNELSRADEELRSAKTRAERLQLQLNQSDQTMIQMKKKLDQAEAERKQTAEELRKAKEQGSAGYGDTSELMSRYKELENSFFDIQMENLQLKNELDKLKKQEL